MRACSAAFALMLALGTALVSMRASHAGKAIERSGNPLWAVPLRELSATRDRPIFSPSRRPPAPPAVLAVAPAPPRPVAMPPVPDRPPLALVGTVIGESIEIAIFLEETTRKTARLKTGEDYQGWILRSVATREARFESAHRTAILALPPPAQVAMTGSSAPPTAEPIAPVQHRKR